MPSVPRLHIAGSPDKSWAWLAFDGDPYIVEARGHRDPDTGGGEIVVLRRHTDSPFPVATQVLRLSARAMRSPSALVSASVEALTALV